MKKMIGMIAVAVSLIAAPSFALELQDARAQGVVGETRAGYIAKIGGGADVAQLVADVNLKRRGEYERISADKHEPVDVVGKLAYGQIVANLPQGAKYQDGNGKWATK